MGDERSPEPEMVQTVTTVEFGLVLDFVGTSQIVLDKVKEVHEARGERIPDKKLWSMLLCKVFPKALKMNSESSEEYEAQKEAVLKALSADTKIVEFMPELIKEPKSYTDYQFYDMITKRMYSYCKPEVIQTARAILKTPKYRALRDLYISNNPNYYMMYMNSEVVWVDIDLGIKPGWV